ncbi:Serine/threonine-protein phosphatase 7 long form-like protein [Bienertia sinuspersici]
MEDIICTCRNALANIHLLDAVYASMFLYECDVPMMHYFCESWCPKTNTILTVAGETSISLWDIRTLTGLPITGILYDEFVPTAFELTGSKDGKQCLPPSCSSYVTFEEWCRFWFRGPKKYSTTSLPQVEKDFSALRTSKPWNDFVHEAFVILDIPEEHRMDTYLAGFLTCWLCAFVLPLKDLGCIRPSVFKPASLLVSGKRISLFISVLTCIYKGLGELSSSFTPRKQVEHFPAHYIYAWLARYFRSHRMGVHDFVGAPLIAFYGTDAIKTLARKEAKSSICSGLDINWVIIAPNDTISVKYVDDSMQSQQVTDFFLSMRSCFLTLRYDNNCIAEPYSPHRFSRQFGFHQYVPGELKPPPEKITRQYLCSLLQTSVRLGTHSSFVIPARGLKMNLRVTDNYTSWWKSTYSSSVNSLNLPSPPKSSEGRRSKSQKRKADNTPLYDKAAKATRDS